MDNKESNNKTVYFYAVDPGALAIMSPVVNASPNAVNCLWVAEGYAKQKLNSKGTNTIELDELLNEKARDLPKGVVLVLGSQHNFGRTIEALKVCSALGIKTVFIFDHWGNFGHHFTSSNGSLIIPTRILVIDDYIKSELVSLGINKTRIATIGHSGIEYTVESARLIDSINKKKIKENLGLKFDDLVILLALEPLRKSAERFEYEAVFSVLTVLKTIEGKDIRLFVRLHPRQSRTKFLDFLESRGLTESLILCPETVSDAESLIIADIVIGISSVFLVSALALGIPSISLQLNLKDQELNANKIPYLEKIKVNNLYELSVRISEKLSQKSGKKISFPFGSVRKAWDEIRMLI